MNQPTDLIYMREMSQLTCDATVLEVTEEEDRQVVILDQTVFYPQGGGQPYDQGQITAPGTCFMVEEVRFVEGFVKHYGHFSSGSLRPGDKVTCEVEAERRLLMSRLHSAGHLVDMAVSQLGLDWIPGKGFHFPTGPYVEYEGALPEDPDRLKQQLEKKANNLIKQNIQTRIEFMSKEAMTSVCRYVPDYLPENKPARVVFYDNYGVPCGGTHLAQLKDIGKLAIRKIKLDKGRIRVSYEIEP